MTVLCWRAARPVVWEGRSRETSPYPDRPSPSGLMAHSQEKIARIDHPADATASQLCKTSAATLPLFPGDGAQPPPGPFIKRAQCRRGLAEAKVAAPSNKIDGQLVDNLREASAAVRRVSSRTLALKRASACGAMQRRGCSPYVKLKPRNLRTLGLATALLALLTFSLRRLARKFSMPAITRSPAR